MTQVFVVILAGGSGERLWPLSSPSCPKQLIPFINGTSLLEQTIQRVQPLVRAPENLIIVTNDQQRSAVAAVVGDRATVMSEPVGRNTGPAILFTCLHIHDRYPDAVVAVIPSDHFIPDTTAFVAAIQTAVIQAEYEEKLILLGVRPTHPATGYGYIQYDEAKPVGTACFAIDHFHEKPDVLQASVYLEQPSMLWNIGMFIGKASLFVREFEWCASDLFYAVKAYRAGTVSYNSIPAYSIDYAVIEKTPSIVVLPVSFTWFDVGNLATFLTLQATYDPSSIAPCITVAGQNNVASTRKKVVAFVGVSDLCVVETDDALVIVARDQAEAVRQVVSIRKAKELGDGVV